MDMILPSWQWALESAQELMICCPELEPTSALKQAASDCGIQYGGEMGAFVAWANGQLFGGSR